MFLQYIFNGLAIGMAYALVAVGYSLVFGILRLETKSLQPSHK